MPMAEWQRNSHPSTLAVNVDLDWYFDIKDEESKTLACDIRRGLDCISLHQSKESLGQYQLYIQ